MPKKLAIYLPNLAAGGAERMHITLAPLFLEAGFDVIFVLQKAEGALLLEVHKNVRVVSLHCSRTLNALFPLMRFLRKEKPEILLSNFGHNNIVAIIANALTGRHSRIIASYHSVFSAECSQKTEGKYRALPVATRIFLPCAHGIIAVSHGAGDDLAHVTGIARDRISVIYNSIASNFDTLINEPITHPWLKPNQPLFIVGVGRLTASKDFKTLIEAFALVARSKNARLMILGEGELKESLLFQASSLGIADRVLFLGYVANPLPLIRKAAMLVCSSRYEGFGNALVEALACGTNVVSTDCPYGPAEILENGRFAKLVPVGDIQALANAIITTLENTIASEILQTRGRAFSAERTAGGYIKLFNNVLSLTYSSPSGGG